MAKKKIAKKKKGNKNNNLYWILGVVGVIVLLVVVFSSVNQPKIDENTNPVKDTNPVERVKFQDVEAVVLSVTLGEDDAGKINDKGVIRVDKIYEDSTGDVYVIGELVAVSFKHSARAAIIHGKGSEEISLPGLKQGDKIRIPEFTDNIVGFYEIIS